MEVKRELNFDDLDRFFWSGARDRWNDATDDQKERVWDLIQEVFADEIPTETEVNDFVWFECDDIFNEKDEDEEKDESRKVEVKQPRKLPRKNARCEAVDMDKPLWEGWTPMDYAKDNEMIMDMIMSGRSNTYRNDRIPKNKAELKKAIMDNCTPNVPKLQRAVVDFFAKKYGLR